MIHLGDLARDEITGYEGIVLARLECLYEATSCRVHSRKLDENGRIRDSIWIEEDRLIVVEENAVVGFKNVTGVSHEARERQNISRE
jgi:hypothetical protein